MAPMAISREAALYAVKLAAFNRQAVAQGLKGLFSERQIAPAAPGAMNKVKAFGKHVGEFGREFVFGSPVTLAEKLKERHQNTGSWAKALGGHAKDFYVNPKDHIAFRALNVGLPALELGNVALRGDPDTRKGDLAHAVSGIAAAPFTSRLGIPGMMAQSAIQSGAQSLASRFDRRAPHAAPAQVPYPAPIDHPAITQAREVAGGPVARHALNVLKPTPDAA